MTHEQRCRVEDIPPEQCHSGLLYHLARFQANPKAHAQGHGHKFHHHPHLMGLYRKLQSKLHPELPPSTPETDNSEESKESSKEGETQSPLDYLANHGKILGLVTATRPHYASSVLNHIWLIDD